MISSKESIDGIKGNLDEMKQDLITVNKKSKHGDSIDSELYLLNERLWNIEQYILILEELI